MSFTVKVKEELLSLAGRDKNELSAMIKMSGSLGLAGSGLTLSVTTENAKIARHIYELLSDLYQVKSEIRHHQKTNLRKNRTWLIPFLVLRQGLTRPFCQMMKPAEPTFGEPFSQMAACGSQTQASTSWKSCPFIWIMLRTWLP